MQFRRGFIFGRSYNVYGMKILQRATTTYDTTEDRIRLVGSTASGQTCVLWLTQRLLGRLVVLLCQRLEQETKQRQTVSGSLNAHLEQSFAQQRARAELQVQVQKPVQPEAQVVPWLVETVDVTFDAVGLQLTFKGLLDADQAALKLPVFGLRQWLDILYGHYLRAAWSVQAWPMWMEEAAAAPSQSVSRGALH